MIKSSAPGTRATEAPAARRVSQRHDATERQADRAADIVARGGSVTGWSFATVPAEASVHRDEEEKKKPPETPAKLEDKPKTQSESYAEGAGKVAEGLLRTTAGQEVQQRITSSKPLTGAIAAGMLAAGKEVPIPLGRGVTLGVKVEGLTEGRVNSAGVSLSFGGGSTRKATAKPVIDRDSQKLMESIRAQTEVQPQQTPAIRPLWVPKSVPQLPPPTPAGQGWMFNPLVPGASVRGGQPTQQPPQPDEVKKEDEVRRAPATASEAPAAEQYDTSGVDSATRGGGRALDPALRHSMEARFGYDFSSVRLHDDPQAASAAAGVDAAAFTVGEHIVFGSGRFDPSSPEGRHLIAHELAHVVQQRGGAAPRTTGAPTRVHRRSFWQDLAVFFGAEGSWSDAELQGYLRAITKANAHDGSYDADNKARAVVRKWKAGSAGWELTGQQMALLIDEMIDGPTLDDDEDAILDLLELATADELLVIFREPGKRYASLNVDFHGAQQDRLDDFVARRFKGAGTALAQGTAQVVGPPIPSGSPSFAFDAAQFDARFEDEFYGLDPASVVARLSPADRAKARDHVLRTTRPRWNGELDAVIRQRVAETDPAARTALRKKERMLQRRVRALDLFIADTLHRQLPASAEDALAATAPVRGEEAKAARAALTPPRPKPKRSAPAPAPAPTPSPPGATSAPSVPKPKQSAAERCKEETARKKEEAAQKAKEEAERKAMFAPGGKYRTLVAAALATKIDKSYKSARAQGAASKPSEIERMAKPAKDATDGVFGMFYSAGARPELTFGGGGRTQTLFSWHDRQTTAVKSAAPDERVTWALGQIRYYFRSDPAFDAINAECDARPETVNGKRNDEAQALEDVAQAAVADGVSATWEDDPQTTADKLIYIDRNWGGAQVGGQIYVDMFQTGDVDEDRAARWKMFQTLIHEYGHTLAHSKYRQHALDLKKSSEREWNTLMEGVDSLLTDVVWSRSGRGLMAHRPTRELVEGTAWAALPPISVGQPSAYASITEAQRLVDVVGADNVWTAYFLGKVDRIGGPPDRSRP